MSRASDDVVELPLADTLRGYDLWSETYEDAENSLLAASRVVLDARPLGAGGRDVIELGCGTGRNVARVLAEGARSYLGVDGSAGMLDRARRRAVDPHVAWLLADLTAPLAVASAAFDVALIVLVLEHVGDPRPLFAEVARMLRPGGRLRIVDIHGALVSAGTVAHFVRDRREIRFTSVAHSPERLADVLRASGLEPLRIGEVVVDQGLIARVPDIGRYAGRSVLLDVDAVRPGS